MFPFIETAGRHGRVPIHFMVYDYTSMIIFHFYKGIRLNKIMYGQRYSRAITTYFAIYFWFAGFRANLDQYKNKRAVYSCSNQHRIEYCENSRTDDIEIHVKHFVTMILICDVLLKVRQMFGDGL